MKTYIKLPIALFGITFSIMILENCGKISDPPFVLEEVIDLQNCWSTVGAAGHMDEHALDHLVQGQPPKLPDEVEGPGGGEILNFDGLIGLRANSPKGTYQVRYPIRQQFFFNKVTDRKYGFVLTTRWKIPDQEKYRIRILLKRYNLKTAPPNERVEILTVLDSDLLSVGDDFQINSTDDREIFDFSRFAYYVEAQFIIKQGPGPIPEINAAVPSLAFIQICAGSIVE